MRTIASAFLCPALFLPAPAAEPTPRPEGAGLAVGIVVVVVGGVAVYKMVKICSRLFPKSTNSEPSQVVGTVGADEYGASWNYGVLGSCTDSEQDQLGVNLDGNIYVSNLNIAVDEFGSVSCTISASKADPSQYQTWTEFQQEVASHGLLVSQFGDGSKYYSRNRMPCGSELVPLAFNDTDRSVTMTGGSPDRMRTLVIERSTDMVGWAGFLTVNSPWDSRFRVDDLTRSGSMFYRVRIQ